jgi:hypothetical protein
MGKISFSAAAVNPNSNAHRFDKQKDFGALDRVLLLPTDLVPQKTSARKSISKNGNQQQPKLERAVLDYMRSSWKKLQAGKLNQEQIAGLPQEAAVIRRSKDFLDPSKWTEKGRMAFIQLQTNIDYMIGSESEEGPAWVTALKSTLLSTRYKPRLATAL